MAEDRADSADISKTEEELLGSLVDDINFVCGDIDFETISDELLGEGVDLAAIEEDLRREGLLETPTSILEDFSDLIATEEMATNNGSYQHTRGFQVPSPRGIMLVGGR